MYHLLGLKENIKNQYILARVGAQQELEKITIDSYEDLKRYNNNYLASIQNAETTSATNQLELLTDLEKSRLIIDVMNQESTLDDLNQSRIMKARVTPPEAASVNLINEALKFISKNDPDLYSLIQQTINFIVFADSTKANGGSVSNAIGCIWLAPKSDWTLQDAAEILVHEMTHSLLFIDERCYGHYPSYEKLNLPSNWAHSSILAKPRPLDKMVHSFIVATEVLAFRKRFFDLNAQTYIHPKTERIIENAQLTYESLTKMDDELLSQRAKHLIDSTYKLFTEIMR